MKVGKHHLIVFACLACFVVVIAFCLWFFNTEVIFHRRLNFKLPKTVDIIKKSYSLYDGDFRLSASFEANDYQEIVYGIENYLLVKDLFKIDIGNDGISTSFEQHTWWNPEEENVIVAHHSYTRGTAWVKRSKSVHILITQNNEGLYFLHVRLQPVFQICVMRQKCLYL